MPDVSLWNRELEYLIKLVSKDVGKNPSPLNTNLLLDLQGALEEGC